MMSPIVIAAVMIRDAQSPLHQDDVALSKKFDRLSIVNEMEGFYTSNTSSKEAKTKISKIGNEMTEQNEMEINLHPTGDHVQNNGA
jgi:hypothetical protein